MCGSVSLKLFYIVWPGISSRTEGSGGRQDIKRRFRDMILSKIPAKLFVMFALLVGFIGCQSLAFRFLSFQVPVSKASRKMQRERLTIHADLHGRIENSATKMTLDNSNLILNAANQSESNNNTLRTLRILALHGKGGSGPSFHRTLDPIFKQMSKKYSLSDKKIDTSLNDAQIAAQIIECDCLTAPYPEGKWWEQVPPGSRSYNAESYQGYTASAELVKKALDSQSLDKVKYDVLLGHSQGAILIASMLANKDLTVDNTPPLLMLNGVAWPNPFSKQLEDLVFGYPSKVETSYGNNSMEHNQQRKALFIIGESDDINPIQGAIEVRDKLQKAGIDVSTIFHSGGHSLPTENETVVQSIVQWVATHKTELSP